MEILIIHIVWIIDVYIHMLKYSHLFADVTTSAISISFGLTIRNKLVYVWADDKVWEFPRVKFYEWKYRKPFLCFSDKKMVLKAN